MGELIERPTGLPGSLDKMVCPEGALRPLPLDKLMEKTCEYMDLESFDEEYPLGDFFNVVSNWLCEYVKNNFVFGDWNYFMNAVMIWERELLILEFYAEKDNLDIPIFLHGTGVDRHYMDQRFDSRAYGILEVVENFYNDTDIEIVNWNEIMTRSRPLIFESPPVDQIKEGFLDQVFEFVEEEYYRYHRRSTLEEYADDYELGFDIISSILREMGTVEFGPFSIRFSDDIQDSRKCMIRCILRIDNVEPSLVVFEEVYKIHHYRLPLEDAQLFIEEVFNEIIDKLIKWNEIMSGREMKNEEKNPRESLVSSTG